MFSLFKHYHFPYTVTNSPTIDISFGTRNALGVQEVCDAGSACNGQTDMCAILSRRTNSHNYNKINLLF